MNDSDEVEQYVRDVLRHIPTPSAERARIAADLRAHLEEAVAAGEAPATVVARMGSPEEVAAEFMAGRALRYAGFWPRLLAFAIDMAIIVALSSALFALMTILSGLVPANPGGLPPASGNWAYVVGTILILVIVSAGLVMVGLFLLYFPILEGRFGQTIGKRLLKLRVVKEDGTAIGFKEAFLRRLSFYFDFLVIDALFIPFTAKHQRAFDIVAHTVVIHERP